MRKLGFKCIELDLHHGCDLLSKRTVQRIRGTLASGVIDVIHIATPCSSFSRAREMGGCGPPPLRSDLHPLGLPDLRPKDAEKVKQGNALARVTTSLASTAMHQGISGSIENPATSRIWQHPSFKHLALRKAARWVTTDFCGFQTPWRKRTKVMYWFSDLSPLHRQCNSKKGICQFSGKKHVVLQGLQADGRFRTAVAEPYPSGLCSCWARCFLNARATLENSVLRTACGL